jgi:transcriptional regulator
MYVPPHFEESRIERIHDLIELFPFGMLVTHTADGLDANHIPFHLVRNQGPFGALLGHVARANPIWRDVASGAEVLAVFRGGDAYVSPNWYPSKHETHRQVPTWNYRVAHAHGRIVFRDDERFVRGVMARLTHTHEATQTIPWKMSDGPRDFIDAMVRAVIGFEIQITRLVGKSKLGQNKEQRDIEGAARGMKEQGRDEIADAMLDIVLRIEPRS